MEDYWKEPTQNQNIKKIILITGIVLAVIAIVTLVILYQSNQLVQTWMDKNIFRKEIKQDNTTTIEIKDTQNAHIFAYGKNIGILTKNEFKLYNNAGKEEATLPIEVSNPTYDTCNRFLLLAETKGKRVYLIEEKKTAWQIDVTSEISQVHVNKNGYVAIVMSDTTYKAVIAVYTPKGEHLFNLYLSTTRVVDVSISQDNKKIAIAEIDTSGTIIKSSIKIIAIEKAKNDTSNNSIEKTYESQENELITKVMYQEKGQLVCMYTDATKIIQEDKEETIIENKNKKITFCSIELNDYAVSVEEVSSGLFTANSIVNIVDVNNKNQNTYTSESVTKEIYTYDNVIALNLGTEIEFINTNRMAY